MHFKYYHMMGFWGFGGGYSVGGYSVGGYSEPATDFGAGD